MIRCAVVVVVMTVTASACSAGGDEAGSTTTADLGVSVATTVVAATAPSEASAAAPVVVPEGFDRVQATVTTADGETCEVCLWLAETPEQRSRGLMFVNDLGNTDGMAFVYPEPRTGTFWMKNTLIPLSIAFFGADGGHLGEFDMEPCAADPCPRYPTARDFTVAVETHLGELGDVGIGPGSTLQLTDIPCPGP